MKSVLTPHVTKFARLTFLSEAAPLNTLVSGKPRSIRRIVCQCQCGSEPSTYLLCNVSTGHTRSCGCLQLEAVEAVGKKSATHGLSDDPLYKIWQMMLARCHNTNNSRYKWYGARGITVCDKWRSNVAAFVKWARSNGYRTGLELDRRNNDLGYNPRNCRWVTHLVNVRNSRVCKQSRK